MVRAIKYPSRGDGGKIFGMGDGCPNLAPVAVPYRPLHLIAHRAAPTHGEARQGRIIRPNAACEFLAHARSIRVNSHLNQ